MALEEEVDTLCSDDGKLSASAKHAATKKDDVSGSADGKADEGEGKHADGRSGDSTVTRTAEDKERLERLARDRLAHASLLSLCEARSAELLATMVQLFEAQAEGAIATVDRSCTWLPQSAEDGAASQLERNLFFYVVGRRMGDDCEEEARRGLVRPLNLRSDGEREGVNSIVFSIRHGSTLLALKGLLAVQFGDDDPEYGRLFASQSTELIALTDLAGRGGVTNVVRLLHAFTATSALIRPWVGAAWQEFLRGQTTYYVLPLYPATFVHAAPSLPRFPSWRLLLWLISLLDGAASMLRAGWLHRDIKLDNVFVDSCGRAVLADLGEAKRILRPDGDDIAFAELEQLAGGGSPLARPPELSAMSEEDAACGGHTLRSLLSTYDVYSIGVMLVNALARGERRLSAGHTYASPEELLEAIQLPPHLPAKLCNLLARCASAQPDWRPSAADGAQQARVLLWGALCGDGKPLREADSVSDVRHWFALLREAVLDDVEAVLGDREEVEVSLEEVKLDMDDGGEEGGKAEEVVNPGRARERCLSHDVAVRLEQHLLRSWIATVDADDVLLAVQAVKDL